jgi:hypothetical protein
LLRLCQISARSPEVKDSAAGLSLEEGCATAGSHEIKATVAKHTTAISFRVEATSIASLAGRQKSLAVCGKTWKLKFFSVLRVIAFGVFDPFEALFGGLNRPPAYAAISLGMRIRL